MRVDDLDNVMDVLDTEDAKASGRNGRPAGAKADARELVGTVEHFFDKINVVAIKLSGALRVGDTIEIGDVESSVRQKVTSMQINREDVEEAFDGDSVGIKIGYRVQSGSSVYKV